MKYWVQALEQWYWVHDTRAIEYWLQDTRVMVLGKRH